MNEKEQLSIVIVQDGGYSKVMAMDLKLHNQHQWSLSGPHGPCDFDEGSADVIIYFTDSSLSLHRMRQARSLLIVVTYGFSENLLMQRKILADAKERNLLQLRGENCEIIETLNVERRAKLEAGGLPSFEILQFLRFYNMEQLSTVIICFNRAFISRSTIYL